VGDVLAAHEALEPGVGPQVGRPADVDAHSAVRKIAVGRPMVILVARHLIIGRGEGVNASVTLARRCGNLQYGAVLPLSFFQSMARNLKYF